MSISSFNELISKIIIIIITWILFSFKNYIQNNNCRYSYKNDYFNYLLSQVKHRFQKENTILHTIQYNTILQYLKKDYQLHYGKTYIA